jgi:hypothetical protein
VETKHTHVCSKDFQLLNTFTSSFANGEREP